MMAEIKRSFIPGSEWLYYKIYCGNHTSDNILTEVVFPVVKKLQNQKIIKSWFFIRYSDPDNHLRVRFRLNEPGQFNDILGLFSDLLEPYFKTKKIWKIQLDTYEREIERYGLNTMEISETLFNHDSEEVLNFLTIIDFNSEKVKYLFAIQHMYNIISSFLGDVNEQFYFVKECRVRYKKEFNVDKKFIRQLDSKYRAFKENYFDGIHSEDNSNNQYSDSLNIISNEINVIKSKGNLQIAFNELIWSYIHMSVNRIFNEHQRQKEFVCYEFLFKELKTMKYYIPE